MTSTPQNEQSPTGTESAPSTSEVSASMGSQPRRLQDDPRAKLALAKKSQAANPTASTGAGHVKAANESSKQGKKEKKVRW
ncbi:hypothetical protein RCH21_001598 [Arthrobacter sp. PL16]|uniref:hypothetical protein n=1 Tax=Arthrobacter sp. PL16 TaxID=3071720 RepID=UPI002E03885C|nr:hypothetical protein [Arthrobacter sp. PL16]